MAHQLHNNILKISFTKENKMNYNVVTLGFVWDNRKASRNRQKHGVAFEEARSIFDDVHHLSILDTRIQNEDRWVTMGVSEKTRLLVVVHTHCILESGLDCIRIISARKATTREEFTYEKGI